MYTCMYRVGLFFVVVTIIMSVFISMVWTEVIAISLSLAPPLTVENVLAAVKNVRNWRSLGEIMGYSWTLDAIQQQYDSDEDCLKALVECFFRDGDQFEQPSWRRVIWCLYSANELQIAEQIRSYAEPVQGTVI